VIIYFDLTYVNMVPPAVVLGDPDATETLCSDLETRIDWRRMYFHIMAISITTNTGLKIQITVLRLHL
jgi:hypothetical protein